MREPESWQPSKYRVDAAGRLRPRPGYVLPGSRFVCQRSVDRLAPLIRAHAVGRLLDCGCGDVPYYALYRDACDAVTCIDWEASSHGARHVDQAVDLNAGLPFADASFDTVLLADVLEHIVRPWQLLAEIGRVLAPGGRLIGSVPFLYWVHEAPHDHHRYTRFALDHHLRAAGLIPETIQPYGGYPDLLIDLVSKQCLRRDWMAGPALALLEPLVRLGPYRRWSARSAETYPLGYVFVATRLPA